MDDLLKQRLEEPADIKRRSDGVSQPVRLQPADCALELTHHPPAHKERCRRRDETHLE